MIKQPFQPKYGSNQTLAPAAGSATVTIDVNPGNRQARFINRGANVCYVRVGDGTQGAATVADMPIAPGMVTTVSKDPRHTSLSHISAGGTTLEVMVGEGY